MRWFSLLLLLATVGAPATADPLREIKQAYHRVARAWELKYLDGIQAVRSSNFIMTSPDRVPIAAQVEERRVESLLGRCTQIRDKIQIRAFHKTGPWRATCLVSYNLRLEMGDSASGKLRIGTLDISSQDDWVYVGGCWKMCRSRVLKQDARMEGSHSME